LPNDLNDFNDINDLPTDLNNLSNETTSEELINKKTKHNKLININHLLHQLVTYNETNTVLTGNPKLTYIGVVSNTTRNNIITHTNFQNGTINVECDEKHNNLNVSKIIKEYNYNILSHYDILCHVIIKIDDINNIEKIVFNINDTDFIFTQDILYFFFLVVNEQNLILIDPSVLIVNYTLFNIINITNFNVTVFTYKECDNQLCINVTVADTVEKNVMSKYDNIKWINLEELTTYNNYLNFTNYDINTGNIFIKAANLKKITITIEINNFKLILNEKMLQIYHNLYQKVLYNNEIIVIPFILDPNIKYTKKYIKVDIDKDDDKLSKIVILKDHINKSSLVYTSLTICSSQKMYSFDIKDNVLIDKLNNFILKELVIFYENIDTTKNERIASNFLITYDDIKYEYDELICDIYSNLYHKNINDIYMVGFSLYPKENQPSGEIVVNHILIKPTLKQNIDITKYKMNIILYGYELQKL
jgi:hypothetical protein